MCVCVCVRACVKKARDKDIHTESESHSRHRLREISMHLNQEGRTAPLHRINKQNQDPKYSLSVLSADLNWETKMKSSTLFLKHI